MGEKRRLTNDSTEGLTFQRGDGFSRRGGSASFLERLLEDEARRQKEWHRLRNEFLGDVSDAFFSFLGWHPEQGGGRDGASPVQEFFSRPGAGKEKGREEDSHVLALRGESADRVIDMRMPPTFLTRALVNPHEKGLATSSGEPFEVDDRSFDGLAGPVRLGEADLPHITVSLAFWDMEGDVPSEGHVSIWAPNVDFEMSGNATYRNRKKRGTSDDLMIGLNIEGYCPECHGRNLAELNVKAIPRDMIGPELPGMYARLVAAHHLTSLGRERDIPWHLQRLPVHVSQTVETHPSGVVRAQMSAYGPYAIVKEILRRDREGGGRGCSGKALMICEVSARSRSVW
jgi:hypothetical protein